MYSREFNVKRREVSWLLLFSLESPLLAAAAHRLPEVAPPPPAVPPPSYVSPQLCTRRSYRNTYSFTMHAFGAAGESGHASEKTKVGFTSGRNVLLIHRRNVADIKTNQSSRRETKREITPHGGCTSASHPVWLSPSTTVSPSASQLSTSTVPAQNSNNCANDGEAPQIPSVHPPCDPPQTSSCTLPMAATFRAFF